jgi:hypothetical protein
MVQPVAQKLICALEADTKNLKFKINKRSVKMEKRNIIVFVELIVETTLLLNVIVI